MFSQPDLAILRIPAILLAITVHEYAHGWVAWFRGDNTARDAGRLTLNPFAHLDIFGFLMMMFGPFGWAKPVPVNTRNLDNPRRDTLWVSLAGPVSNIILALIFGFTLRFLSQASFANSINHYVFTFLALSLTINLGLSFFNLLPIPPLDGSNIVLSLLPPSKIMPYLKIMQHVPKIFLVLILVEWLTRIPLFSMLIYPVWEPYQALWQYIIFGAKGL